MLAHAYRTIGDEAVLKRKRYKAGFIMLLGRPHGRGYELRMNMENTR